MGGGCLPTKNDLFRYIQYIICICVFKNGWYFLWGILMLRHMYWMFKGDVGWFSSGILLIFLILLDTSGYFPSHFAWRVSQKGQKSNLKCLYVYHILSHLYTTVLPHVLFRDWEEDMASKIRKYYSSSQKDTRESSLGKPRGEVVQICIKQPGLLSRFT